MSHLTETNEQTLNLLHVQSYISCPYRFYFQNQLRNIGDSTNWREMTQLCVNKIVQKYYLLQKEERTSYNILQLIREQWRKIDPACFSDTVEYVTTFARFTDHLLHFLLSEQQAEIPLFLFESIPLSSVEKGLVFDVALWGERSFVIKKFLVDVDDHLLHSYFSAVEYFSQKAFHILPEQIEVLDLGSARRHIHLPKQLNASMVEPICFTCPIVNDCKE
ncbi:hypothetical protein [Halalkalibacterium ligniniphilum]|uniref:hypothetical protein n=1 Tax=Halalkalibacterium ligniniphilum TaxID=1134413 RepID=UPI00034CC0E1|nr:hypothetical protein [Halalkalibacterium ligniniphilum]